MRTIVLPGQGTPTTFTVAEDSTVSVLIAGRIVTLPLKAGSTRIEFLGSQPKAA